MRIAAHITKAWTACETCIGSNISRLRCLLRSERIADGSEQRTYDVVADCESAPGRIIVKIVFGMAAALCLTALSTGAIAADDNSCGAAGTMSLQLLGSGDPISDDARASSGTVVWINSKSRLLIDAGGGTHLRFGQAGARLEDLRFIGITHFHTDHVADLPAILKGAYFVTSDTKITLAGPRRGLGLRREFAAELNAQPKRADIDFLEVVPDNWMGVGGESVETLEGLASKYPFVAHSLRIEARPVSPKHGVMSHAWTNVCVRLLNLRATAYHAFTVTPNSRWAFPYVAAA